MYCCTMDHLTSGTKYNVPRTMRSFLNTPPVVYSIRAWHRRFARESWLCETGFCNFQTTCNWIGVIAFIRPRRRVYYTHLRCSIIGIDRVTCGYWGKKSQLLSWRFSFVNINIFPFSSHEICVRPDGAEERIYCEILPFYNLFYTVITISNWKYLVEQSTRVLKNNPKIQFPSYNSDLFSRMHVTFILLIRLKPNKTTIIRSPWHFIVRYLTAKVTWNVSFSRHKEEVEKIVIDTTV